MDDAVTARPGDERANTLRSILAQDPDMKLPNLEKLGLMNAYGCLLYTSETDFLTVHLCNILM